MLKRLIVIAALFCAASCAIAQPVAVTPPSFSSVTSGNTVGILTDETYIDPDDGELAGTENYVHVGESAINRGWAPLTTTSLRGIPLLHTKQSDAATEGASTVVSVTVDRPVTAAVCHDATQVSKPSWLSTNYTIDAQTSLLSRTGVTYDCYVAAAPASGTINLGGNCPTGGCTGSPAMYVVLLMPSYNRLRTPLVSVPSLTSPWLQADVGAVLIEGTASDDGSTLTASGQGDLHGTSDVGHFVYEALSGDQKITQCVSDISGGDPEWHRAGLSVRDDDPTSSPTSAYVSNTLSGHTAHGWRSQTRARDGAQPSVLNSNVAESPASDACAQILYVGGVFSMSYGASESGPWTQYDSETLTFSGTNYWGHWISGANTEQATSTSTLPTITTPAGDPGTLQFTSATFSVDEDGGTLDVTVSRSGGTSGAASIDVVDLGTGSASAGTDYTALSCSGGSALSWSAGVGGTQTCTITITDRSGVQTDRTIDLDLQNASGAAEGTPGTSTATIHDTDAAQAGAIKWDYGPYVRLASGGDDHDTILSTRIPELCNMPNVKGFMVTRDWVDFESSKDTYDFSEIEALMDAGAAACGLKFGVQIHAVSFFHNNPTAANCDGILPSYLFSGTYGGGVTLTTNNDRCVAMTWKQAVMDRLIALVDAMGTEFDANPNFEFVMAVSETAIGQQRTNVCWTYPTCGSETQYSVGYNAGLLVTQLERLAPAARTSFPGTNVCFMVNSMTSPGGSDALFNELFDVMSDNAICLGAPDTFPQGLTHTLKERTNGQKIYMGALGTTDYRGELAYMPQIQPPEIGGRSGNFTPGEHHDELTTLGANIVIVQRKDWPINGTFDTTPLGTNTDDLSNWATDAGGFTCPGSSEQNDGTCPMKDFINSGGMTMTGTCPTSYVAQGGCRQ